MVYQRRMLVAGIAGVMLSVSALHVRAQQVTYPARPVKIVVGYAPGGAADVASRMLAEWMGARMGQVFVVENRPGASGTLAANQVSKAPNDGYTLSYGPGFGMTMGSGASRVEYKPDQLFEPVNLMVELPLVLIVNNALPVSNLKELVSYVQSKPGALNYASYGKGTTSHLASEALVNQNQLKIEHILYKGSAPALLALRAGDVQMMFDTVASAAPQIKAGAVRAISVTSERRMELLPDVPTMKEEGMPSVGMSGWMGLYAPKGTAPSVVQALSREVSAYLSQPAAKERMATMGFVAQDRGPEQFRELIIRETARIDRLVREANINLD